MRVLHISNAFIDQKVIEMNSNPDPCMSKYLIISLIVASITLIFSIYAYINGYYKPAIIVDNVVAIALFILLTYAQKKCRKGVNKGVD